MNEYSLSLRADAAPSASHVGTADVIDDNSKRGISVRIFTSDYGRIKAIARRLRVREPEVIRYAIKAGLAQLAPLTVNNSSRLELLELFAAHGGALVEHLKLNAGRLEQLLNNVDSAQKISANDIQLLTMANLPGHMLAPWLRDITGTAVQPEDAHSVLYQYLMSKYQTAEASANTP